VLNVIDVRQSYDGWDKYSAPYWRQNYPDFLEFFARQVHLEPHSTKHIEDFIEWGRGTTGETLIQTVVEGAFPEAEELCARIGCPTLIVHGTEDAITPLASGQALHDAIRGSELVVIEGAGHTPHARDPVRGDRAKGEKALGPVGSVVRLTNWLRSGGKDLTAGSLGFVVVD